MRLASRIRQHIVAWGFALAAAQAASPGPQLLPLPELKAHQVQFRDGQAIWQGDIVVGTEAAFRAAQAGKTSLANSSRLWPVVNGVAQVPYTLTVTPAGGAAATFIRDVIAQFNTTFTGVIQFVPAAQQENVVAMTIREQSAGTCGGSSAIGMTGGRQSFSMDINPANCPAAIPLHEMGHTIGLFHEQARSDRNNYIKVNYQAVSRGNYSEFDQLGSSAADVGVYDYGSTMHYGPYLFVRDSSVPNLETIPVGIPIQENGPYSAGDIDTVRRLYGATPQQVTVTSNPAGLKVLVDGATVTTPQTFTWAIGSTHSLDVAPGVQTLNEGSFVFSGTSDAALLGRWSHRSAGQPVSHTITVTAGDGSPTRPTTAPAITVYMANFIELIPVPTSLTNPANGTVQISPAPLTVGADRYVVAQQPVTLTATPAASYNFYDWNPTVRLLSTSYSVTPLQLRPTRQGLNLRPSFTTAPITTISSNPPGLRLTVDGRLITAPKNFATPVDSGWTAGSTHTIAVASNQATQTRSNGSPAFTRFVHTAWSDAGAASHTITVAGSRTITANFTTQYGVIVGSGLECAGTAEIVNQSDTGYHNAGTELQLRVTPSNGWNFTGWQLDFSGTALSLTADGEKLVYAGFNLLPDPLAITSLNPATVTAGSADVVLTVDGTGFATGARLCAGTTCSAPATGPTNRLTLTLPAATLRFPGSLDLSVVQGAGSCEVRSATRSLPITPAGVAPPAPRNRLRPGESLSPDQFLLSPNGAYRLLFQADGTLAIYRLSDGATIWTAHNGGRVSSRLTLEPDGNLVVYGPDGAQWTSRTNGFNNCEAILQDDGSLVIWAPWGDALWSSRWQMIGGILSQLSVAADGTVIGANSANEIYQRNAPGWIRLPGAAPLIAVSNVSLAYASIGTLWRWDGAGWNQLPMPEGVSSFTWISAASDGTLLGVGPDGRAHYRDAQSGAWTVVGTDVYRASVRNANEFYLTKNGTDAIQKVVGGVATPFPGLLRDISVSASGELWGISGNRRLWRWNGSSWDSLPGLMVQVSVGSAGNIFAIDAQGSIYQWQ